MAVAASDSKRFDALAKTQSFQATLGMAGTKVATKGKDQEGTSVQALSHLLACTFTRNTAYGRKGLTEAASYSLPPDLTTPCGDASTPTYASRPDSLAGLEPKRLEPKATAGRLQLWGPRLRPTSTQELSLISMFQKLRYVMV